MDKKKIINIYIIIVTIITVLAIVVGVCRIFRIGNSIFSLGKSSSVSETIKLKEFEKINLDMNVCDVNIKTGDDYELIYVFNGVASENYAPKSEVKDGTLYVTQKDEKKSSLFKTSKSCDITISVPSGVKLKNIEIKTNVGDLNIDDIRCKEMTINSHVGDADIKNVTGDLIELTADVGDVGIKKCEFDTISVTSNVGDVKLKDTICNVVSVDSSIGDVAVENVLDASGNKPQMDINTEIGDKKGDD